MCAIVVHVILYKQTNKQTNKQCSVVKSFLLGHIVSLGMVSVGVLETVASLDPVTSG